MVDSLKVVLLTGERAGKVKVRIFYRTEEVQVISRGRRTVELWRTSV